MTTRIINPCKPSFVTVTGWGVDRIYIYIYRLYIEREREREREREKKRDIETYRMGPLFQSLHLSKKEALNPAKGTKPISRHAYVGWKNSDPPARKNPGPQPFPSGLSELIAQHLGKELLKDQQHLGCSGVLSGPRRPNDTRKNGS